MSSAPDRPFISRKKKGRAGGGHRTTSVKQLQRGSLLRNANQRRSTTFAMPATEHPVDDEGGSLIPRQRIEPATFETVTIGDDQPFRQQSLERLLVSGVLRRARREIGYADRTLQTLHGLDDELLALVGARCVRNGSQSYTRVERRCRNTHDARRGEDIKRTVIARR